MTVPDGEPRRTVSMRVAASPAELPPLRTVAADLAVRADFDLDAVADLRLAVDEAAAELVGLARPDSSLSATFTMLEQQMRTRMAVPADEDSTVATDSFGWRVLTTLADEVHVQHEREDGQPVLVITLCLRRGPVGQAAVDP